MMTSSVKSPTQQPIRPATARNVELPQPGRATWSKSTSQSSISNPSNPSSNRAEPERLTSQASPRVASTVQDTASSGQPSRGNARQTPATPSREQNLSPTSPDRLSLGGRLKPAINGEDVNQLEKMNSALPPSPHRSTRVVVLDYVKSDFTSNLMTGLQTGVPASHGVLVNKTIQDLNDDARPELRASNLETQSWKTDSHILNARNLNDISNAVESLVKADIADIQRIDREARSMRRNTVVNQSTGVSEKGVMDILEAGMVNPFNTMTGKNEELWNQVEYESRNIESVEPEFFQRFRRTVDGLGKGLRLVSGGLLTRTKEEEERLRSIVNERVLEAPQVQAAVKEHEQVINNLPDHVLLVRSAGNDGVNNPHQFVNEAKGEPIREVLNHESHPEMDNVVVVGASTNPEEQVIAGASMLDSFKSFSEVVAFSTEIGSQRQGVASFSSRLPQGPTVTADGNLQLKSLNSPFVGGEPTLAFFQGTSASAPVVSAAIERAWQANPNLTAADMKLLLQGTASRTLGADVRDEGAGRINPELLVQFAVAAKEDPQLLKMLHENYGEIYANPTDLGDSDNLRGLSVRNPFVEAK
jgi:hypothetical protein